MKACVYCKIVVATHCYRGIRMCDYCLLDNTEHQDWIPDEALPHTLSCSQTLADIMNLPDLDVGDVDRLTDQLYVRRYNQ